MVVALQFAVDGSPTLSNLDIQREESISASSIGVCTFDFRRRQTTSKSRQRSRRNMLRLLLLDRLLLSRTASTGNCVILKLISNIFEC